MRTWDQIRDDARPGRAFSNHTQFEIWAANRGCWDNCAHDVDDPPCPIQGVALVHELTPAEWPAREPYGLDPCTEFERRPDPGDGPADQPDSPPPPECDRQTDLLEVAAELALSELHPEREPQPA